MLQVVPRLRSASSVRRPNDGELNMTMASPCVPIEIIDHILKLALMSSATESTTPQFHSIASVTLASMTFRQFALRHYFREITPETKGHWEAISRMLRAQDAREVSRGGKGAFIWVRSLCASSKILSYKPKALCLLTHLQYLSIDLAQEGLSTQHPRLKILFAFLEFGASASLTSLTLSSLPRIDALLLQLIASSFPRLTDLYLSCTERLEFSCCWTCFEDSLGCTIHSPIPDNYIDVQQLADDFASALKPLVYLTHLHLGIFLSDDQLLYSHIAHSLGDEENGGIVDGSGRCSTCFTSAVEDVRMREISASAALALQLKSIRSVAWSSFFIDLPKNKTESEEREDFEYDNNEEKTTDDEETDEEVTGEIALDMKTTIWVWRTNEKIMVRRCPW